MIIHRIYTGEDNESHLETIEVPMEASELGHVSKMEGATGVIFRETPADFFLDYHNAPARQFVVNMGGQTEIEVADGSKVTIGDGDIIFAEDVTGHGHISRGLTGPRHSLFIIMPDSFDITQWK